MIRPNKISSPEQAADYYTRVAKAAEYYEGEGVPSRWSGRAAEEMRLSGAVDISALTNLLKGKVTDAEGERQLGRIGPDGSAQHDAGRDFTISAPKSVSLAALVHGREDVTEAHRTATAKALAYLEEHAQARIRGEVVKTGNLAVASFEHVTSRNGDPQLHTHALVANVTMYQGKAYSLDNRELYSRYSTADAIYHAQLGHELQKAGYRVRFDPDGHVEIEGYSRKDIKDFSSRSAEIEQGLKERGKTRGESSAEMRETIALATRPIKNCVESREANLERWTLQASALGLQEPREDRTLALETIAQAEGPLAKEAVAKAISHLSERDFVFKATDLDRYAARFSKGRVDWKAIKRAIDDSVRSGDLIRRAGRYTTKAAIRSEKFLGKQLAAGRGAHVQVLTERQFKRELRDFERFKGFELSEEQRAAARMILTGNDRFQGVQGLAGTGKTTMLEFVRRAAEEQGWAVIGHSNGAEQASQMETDSGIRSITTAKHLLDQERAMPDVAADAKLARAALDTWERKGGFGKDQAIDFRETARTGVLGQSFRIGMLRGERTQLIDQFRNRAVVERDGTTFLKDSKGMRYAVDNEGNVFSEALFSRKHQLRKYDDLIERSKDGRIRVATGKYERWFKGEGKWRDPRGFVGTAAAKLTIEQRVRQGQKAELERLKENAGVNPRKELRIMDEAGLAGLKEFSKVAQSTEAMDARTVFLGDKLQHQSVESGKAFEQAQANMQVARLGRESIRRQKTEHMRSSVSDILDRKHSDALAKIKTIEINTAQSALREKVAADNADKKPLRPQIRHAAKLDNEAVIKQIAKDYAAKSPEQRSETLVITATNEDRRALNEAIRGELKAKGGLSGGKCEVATLRKVDMTAEEKRSATNYQVGQTVQVASMRGRGNLGRGQSYTVSAIDARSNVLTLRDQQGVEGIVEADSVSLKVYDTEMREFAKGDQIRFTENHKLATADGGELEVRNGQRASVAGVNEDGTVDLRVGGETVQVASAAGFKIDHDYVSTSHASQGKTVNDVWIHHNTERGAHGDRETYVNITRGRSDARIYTQDLDKAGRQAGVELNNSSAIEFAHPEEMREIDDTKEQVDTMAEENVSSGGGESDVRERGPERLGHDREFEADELAF